MDDEMQRKSDSISRERQDEKRKERKQDAEYQTRIREEEVVTGRKFEKKIRVGKKTQRENPNFDLYPRERGVSRESRGRYDGGTGKGKK